MRVADQIGDGEETGALLSDVPFVLACEGKMLGEFGEFARRIDAQARHQAIKAEDQGDDGNHVGPEEARPAEGPQEWRDEQIGNRNQKGEEDGEKVPARHFENADALLAIDRVLKDGLSLLRGEMVEGSKERAKAVELRRDFASH